MKILKQLTGWISCAREVLRLVPLRTRATVIFGLFASSLFELFGLAMILPLLATMSGGKTTKNAIALSVEEIFNDFHLPFSPLAILTIVVVGLSLKALVKIQVMRYVGDVVSSLTKNLRISLIRALLRAKWGFFVGQPLGRLAHVTGPEVSAVGDCFLGLSNIIASFGQIVAYLIVCYLLSPGFATLAIAVGVAMFVWFGLLVNKTRLAARMYRAEIRQIASTFTDAMIGIKPLRAMGRTDHFTKLFENDARRLEQSLRGRILTSEYASEIQEPVIGALIAGSFLLATSYFEMQLHALFVMMIVLVRMIAALSDVQRSLHKFIQDYDVYRLVKGLMADVSAAAEEDSGRHIHDFKESIAFQDVEFGHGQTIILDKVSVEFKAGEITTIVGPSGIGKSTLVDLIVGLYRPKAGRIMVDGHDLVDLDLKHWRQQLGYVPQDVTLFHDTISKNVALWDDSMDNSDILEALEKAAATKFVKEKPNELMYVVGERGSGLSGGQRQRIALARALITKPRVLILDEATTGLDPAIEKSICEIIHAEARRSNIAVIAVTHQPAWQIVADKIIHLDTSERVTSQPCVA